VIGWKLYLWAVHLGGLFLGFALAFQGPEAGATFFGILSATALGGLVYLATRPA
jgi:hypothetical protein